ncbi:hypothetical protein [Sphingomonas alpina]|uniref:Peptidase M1 membrane alanine aminopeptidase domain-containing protein n=1 Tax=Sphingomonas alpina TaxID=653931 RepID=A0A7H0LFU5_9SPHN|nr:hypothetical protein [Sphingomonas alpina]QNQ08548.1 hypothetical protein H3Z74_17610 [Sphingomonas alpina]
MIPSIGSAARCASILLTLLFLAVVPMRAAAAGSSTPHYQFSARFDVKRGTLTAKAIITLPAAGGETAFVLGERFTLTETSTDCGARPELAPTGTPLPHLQRIAIRSGEAVRTACRVTIAYHGPIDEAGERSPSLSADRIELGIDTMWLPVRQDLGMAFSIDADISGLPTALVVMSQGQLTRSGDRLRIHRVISDSDLMLVGAVGLKRITAPDVEFYTAIPDDPLVAKLRENAFGAAAFYRKRFGAPQVGPVRMIVVPRGSGAGYARRGLVVMPTFRDPGAPTPPFDAASPARFVAHEFRHAWGSTPDVVFANYWMSESVAEYFGLRYVEATLGIAERDAMLDRKREVAAKAGPLLGDKRPSGAALYQKGPVLLFALEAKIGRPALDRILARSDPPTTTEAFLARLAEVAGLAVAAGFRARLADAAWQPD